MTAREVATFKNSLPCRASRSPIIFRSQNPGTGVVHHAISALASLFSNGRIDIEASAASNTPPELHTILCGLADEQLKGLSPLIQSWSRDLPNHLLHGFDSPQSGHDSHAADASIVPISAIVSDQDCPASRTISFSTIATGCCSVDTRLVPQHSWPDLRYLGWSATSSAEKEDVPHEKAS